MHRLLARLALVFLCLALPLSALRAQVTASLVAEENSIQPGKPLRVALRLDHKPHWHTYWLYAGTGYATTLKWDLPPGWTATDFTWPTPKLVKDTAGNITGQGYEDTVYLPLTLTPPADLKPGEITLRAKAAWLMCAEVCVPGKADVSLTIPVAQPGQPYAQPNPAIANTLQTKAPLSPAGFTFSAQRIGKIITLRAQLPANSAVRLGTPWFFTANDLVAYDQPQSFSSDPAAQTVTLTLPVSDLAAATQRLTGVLTLGPLAINIDLPPPASAGTAGLQPGSDSTSPTAAASPNLNSAPPKVVQAASLLSTLGLAFVGGLILNLMPCVFPVLGIKILGFVNQAGSDRRKVTYHGLLFTLGVLLSFWALAGLLAILRASGDQLGWGFQLQSPAFVFGLAAVMLVFALSMSGVFEFGLRATGVGANLQMKDGYSGSFFTGVLATIVATPCSAPFLAPALGAALALPTAQSFLIFTAIAVGLSTPYLLLSIFPNAIKALPRPGAWMETFKQFMAFPLYGTTAYLIWVLAGQTSESGLLNSLLGLTVIALATWLYGRTHAPGAKPGRARLGLVSTVALLFIGGWLGWPAKPAPTDIVWEKWSPAAIEAARAAQRPVYLDFTARWCATCQTNKKFVFSSAEVLRQFADKKVVTLKADWTNSDPAITAELAKWGRSAVPFNLLYLPGRADPIVLPELLTPQIVLDALNQK